MLTVETATEQGLSWSRVDESRRNKSSAMQESNRNTIKTKQNTTNKTSEICGNVRRTVTRKSPPGTPSLLSMMIILIVTQGSSTGSDTKVLGKDFVCEYALF